MAARDGVPRVDRPVTSPDEPWGDDAAIVEPPAGEPWLRDAADVVRLLEACFAVTGRAALLRAEHLPPGFLDLSTRVAGGMLQKLRQYEVRLAVVLPADAAPRSAAFEQMAAEERRGRHFAVFDDAAAARAWLRQP